MLFPFNGEKIEFEPKIEHTYTHNTRKNTALSVVPYLDESMNQ